MKRGDWVANSINCFCPCFGKVKDVWDNGDGNITVDVVYYDTNGQKIGRVSEPLGGPTTYEPALDFEDLAIINKPVFPLRRNFSGDYSEYLVPLPPEGPPDAE